jgi:hypothetical protein
METPSPTVPTDNLYKFMALGGLATLLFLVWFVERGFYTVRLEQEKIKGEYATTKLKADALGQDVTNYVQKVTSIERTLAENATKLEQATKQLAVAVTNHLAAARLPAAVARPETEGDVTLKKLQDLKTETMELKTEAKNQEAEHEKLSRELVQRSRELQLKDVELSTESAKLIFTAQELLSLVRVAKWGGSPVFMWMVLGFYLWYMRVQVYQDRILRKEAEERAPKIKKQKPSE